MYQLPKASTYSGFWTPYSPADSSSWRHGRNGREHPPTPNWEIGHWSSSAFRDRRRARKGHPWTPYRRGSPPFHQATPRTRYRRHLTPREQQELWAGEPDCSPCCSGLCEHRCSRIPYPYKWVNKLTGQPKVPPPEDTQEITEEDTTPSDFPKEEETEDNLDHLPAGGSQMDNNNDTILPTVTAATPILVEPTSPTDQPDLDYEKDEFGWYVPPLTRPKDEDDQAPPPSPTSMPEKRGTEEIEVCFTTMGLYEGMPSLQLREGEVDEISREKVEEDLSTPPLPQVKMEAGTPEEWQATVGEGMDMVEETSPPYSRQQELKHLSYTVTSMIHRHGGLIRTLAKSMNRLIKLKEEEEVHKQQN